MKSQIIASKEHFAWIDLIRFLAAFLVVLSHYRGAFFVEYGLLPIEQKTPIIFAFYSITRLGHESVLVFFVLSGFLVGGKAIQRITLGQFDLKSYAIDRTVRIMLPLISALLLIALLNFVTGVNTNFLVWIANLFSLQGILVGPISEPLWSLSYEVWFYIIIGAASMIIIKNKLSNIYFAILLVCFLVFSKLESVYLLIWLMGAFAFLKIPNNTNKFKIIVLGIFLLMVLFLLQMSSSSRSMEDSQWITYLPKRSVLETLFSLLFSLFLINLVILKPKYKFTKKLNNLGSNLAVFSYTLYLTHFPILRLMEYFKFPKSEKININSIFYFLLEILIGLTTAWVIYFFFEKRTKFVKHKIRSLLNREHKLEEQINLVNKN